ncbi:MAG: hypothetical protein ACI4VM_05620 [Anaerovoracaceae bacterium]
MLVTKLVCLGAVGALLCGCAAVTGGGSSGGKVISGEPVDFQSFCITEAGMSAEVDVIRGERQGDGIRLERVQRNISLGDQEVPVREIEGGPELLSEIQSLFAEAGITSWDGFAGACPPGVMDGSSFSFTCTLTDGRTIQASGTNNYPKNYYQVRKAISDMLLYEELESTAFETPVYGLTLPRSWAGQVNACFYPESTVFFIPLENRQLYLLRMEQYPCEMKVDQERVPVGVLTAEGKDDICLYMHLYGASLSPEEGTAEQCAVVDALETDIKTIVTGITGRNGYTFAPEIQR